MFLLSLAMMLESLKRIEKGYVIKNVSGLNKRQMDMAPMIGSAKKNVMYFASTRKGSTGDDVDPITGRILHGFVDVYT